MIKILFAHGSFNLSRAFIAATLTIYLINSGISLSIIALAKSLQLLFSILINYHAGKISERYGDKISIIIACFCAITYFILLLFPNNNTVIIAEIFNGLSIAFYAGAYESIILKHRNSKEDSFSLISRSQEVLFITTILAGLLGSFFFKYAIYFSIVFMFISIFIYGWYKNNDKNSKSKETNINHNIKDFMSLSITNNNVKFSIIFSGMLQLIYQFWPIYVSVTLGIYYNDKILGSIFAISMLFQYIFTLFARKLKINLLNNIKIILPILVFIFSSALIITYIYRFNFLISISLYVIFLSIVSVFSNMLFSKSCDCFINSNNESSMISLLDMGARLFGAICLFIIYIFSISKENVIHIWSIFPIMSIIYLLFILKKKSNKNIL